MIVKTIDNTTQIFGNHIKTVEYKTPLYVHSNDRTDYKKTKEGEKRDDSLSRTRLTLYYLIHSNIRKHGPYPPVFLTLTYKKNQTSLKDANKDFRDFSKRLNYHTSTKLRYISVPEFQERGAVHYHIMYFNLRFIHFSELTKLWTHGSIKIERARDVKNLSAYMTKYLTKGTIQQTLKHHRLILTSQGLFKPKVFHNQDAKIAEYQVTIHELISMVSTEKKITKEQKFIQ